MDLLDFEIDSNKIDEITVEDALEHEEFVREMNYLIEEGFMKVETDADGNVRAYPV